MTLLSGDEAIPLTLSTWPLRPGCTVVACAGDLDTMGAPVLATALREGLDGHVIVDLSAVDFMDSTGLSILLNARRRRLQAGRRMVVLCPPGAARRTLQLSGLEETLSVTDTLAAALERVRRATLVV